MLAVVQLGHGLSFGLTQVGVMGLMVQHVPGHVMARAQGYLTACGGIVASTTAIVSGMVYARFGLGVYDMMAAMAATGVLLAMAEGVLGLVAVPFDRSIGGDIGRLGFLDRRLRRLAACARRGHAVGDGRDQALVDAGAAHGGAVLLALAGTAGQGQADVDVEAHGWTG